MGREEGGVGWGGGGDAIWGKVEAWPGGGRRGKVGGGRLGGRQGGETMGGGMATATGGKYTFNWIVDTLHNLTTDTNRLCKKNVHSTSMVKL